jgi:hypothetical protein
MSFAAGRFADSGLLTGRTGVSGPAWRGAFEATCRPSSRLGSEARAQQSPTEVDIIAIADIALTPHALGAAEDLSLVITVVPLFPPGIPAGLQKPGFPYRLLLRTSIIGQY